MVGDRQVDPDWLARPFLWTVRTNMMHEQNRRNEEPRMLDGLDSIDWASLSHAHGEAIDVPAMDVVDLLGWKDFSAFKADLLGLT